jgi:hypothetical protein
LTPPAAQPFQQQQQPQQQPQQQQQQAGADATLLVDFAAAVTAAGKGAASLSSYSHAAQDIVRKGAAKWLGTDDVHHLLTGYQQLGIEVAAFPPYKPRGKQGREPQPAKCSVWVASLHDPLNVARSAGNRGAGLPPGWCADGDMFLCAEGTDLNDGFKWTDRRSSFLRGKLLAARCLGRSAPPAAACNSVAAHPVPLPARLQLMERRQSR